MPKSADPKRGEVWYVDLDPVVGSEMQKTRPCVVISVDSAGRLPLRLVVPLTGWQKSFVGHFWQVRVDATPGSGLSKDSAADTLQTRCVALTRFSSVGPAGNLPDATVAEIAEALAFTTGYGEDN